MKFIELRIQKDVESFKELNSSNPFLSWFSLEERSFFFNLEVKTSVYNGIYKFRIEFTEEYPFKSPRLFCMTKVFHPNIDSMGRVCLKVLREGWRPCFDINSIVVSLQCCFEFLSGDDALNVEAGDLFEQDFEKFKEKAKACNPEDCLHIV